MEKLETVEWDYLGWNKIKPKIYYGEQSDWNNILVTKINYSSAVIYKKLSEGTHLMGNIEIHVSEEIFKIIKEFTYFDEQNMVLSSRYKIIIDNKLNNIINVVRNDYFVEIIVLNYKKND